MYGSMNNSNLNNQIGKQLKLINLTNLFYESPNAKILNNDLMLSPNYAQELTSAIFTHNDSELGFVPACACGALSTSYYEGSTCPLCRTQVSSEFINKLHHNSWVAITEPLPAVFHPIIYLILKTWSTSKKNEPSIIDQILNPELDLPEDLKEYIPKQGYTYFYNNHIEIFNILINKYPKTANKKNTHFIRLLLHKYKDLLWTRYLPILDRSLHSINRLGSLRFTDNSCREALQCILGISYMNFNSKRGITSNNFIDTELYRAYVAYVNYVESIGQSKLGDPKTLSPFYSVMNK